MIPTSDKVTASDRINQIEELLKRHEQGRFDVGHVKTLAQHAMRAACTNEASEVQAMAQRLLRHYEASRVRYGRAKKALGSLLDVGMGHATAAALIEVIEESTAEVARIERMAVGERAL